MDLQVKAALWDDLQYLPASGRVTARRDAEGKRLEGREDRCRKGARTNQTLLSSAHSRGGGRRVAPPPPVVAKQPAPEVASPGRAGAESGWKMAEGGRGELKEPERGSSRPRPPSARDLQVRRPGARRPAGGRGSEPLGTALEPCPDPV